MAVISEETTTNRPSLIRFVLIGLVLLGLLLGGIWWTKQRSIAANNDKKPPVSQPIEEKKPKEQLPIKKDEPKVAAANQTTPTTTPSAIASTGPALSEIVLSGLMMSLAGYFGIRLIQIRLNTRDWLQRQ